jgi:hypothetical protein
VGADTRNYVAGDFFLRGNASGVAAYEEALVHEGSIRDLSLERSFSGNFGVGVGLGRMRDVTPVLQAQRINERFQALGRGQLSQEDVLYLASVLAQAGGYYRVFDRANRHLWQDVLEPLVARGETLTPFEVYYLGEVFQEQLGSRREGFLVRLSGQLQRDTHDDGNTFGVTSWGPDLAWEWSHNLNLDHQLSAFVDAAYLWADDDRQTYADKGSLLLSFEHQWVVADRMLWSNTLNGSFSYFESDDPFLPERRQISRQQLARLRSVLNFYVENRVRMGPAGELTWRHIETDPYWREDLSWRLGFNISYDLENKLF